MSKASKGITKALIIEDETNFAMNVMDFFNIHHPGLFEFMHFQQADKAYQYLLREEVIKKPRLLPKLILLDLGLPGMLGLEFLAKIKSSTHKAIQRIPVVILTCDNTQETIEEAFSNNVNAYIIKPIESSNTDDNELESIVSALARCFHNLPAHE